MLLKVHDLSFDIVVQLVGTPHALSQRSKAVRLRSSAHTRGRRRRTGKMRAAVRHQLDPSIRSTDTRDFESSLRSKIVGQSEGVQSLVDMYQVFCAGLNSPGRPVGNLLFLGPTGSGKTRIVEAAAEILFGDPRAIIKVDCAEFQHSPEIAKLIGSPPGISGPPQTSPADHSGSFAPQPHRQTEIVVLALRRN